MRELLTLANHAREQAASDPDPKARRLWLQIADEIDAYVAADRAEAETEKALW